MACRCFQFKARSEMVGQARKEIAPRNTDATATLRAWTPDVSSGAIVMMTCLSPGRVVHLPNSVVWTSLPS